VRSFITNMHEGITVKAQRPIVVRGIAFDGGSGITRVDISVDDGKTWSTTELGKDLGRYSFRQWHAKIHLTRGAHALRVRALSRDGQSQPMDPQWNPSGYLRNVVETTNVIAA
jgi:hypothetical protein